MDADLQQVANLIQKRNELGAELTRITRRPMQIGHVGEFIASRIFDIALEDSAVNRGFDGKFRTGKLAGRTVNIKWNAKRESALDLPKGGDAAADYYPVLAGPRGDLAKQIDQVRPWRIERVYLFDEFQLVGELRSRGVKIGIATSVAGKYWEDAEIWPENHCQLIEVSPEQAEALRMFGNGKSDP